MATLQSLLGNRLPMDADLRERYLREYDAMTPESRRAAYVHQARVVHEIQMILQLARDGHSTARNDADVLSHIQALAWSTDGTLADNA